MLICWGALALDLELNIPKVLSRHDGGGPGFKENKSSEGLGLVH
jgi:hypothetical protein